MTKRHEIYKCNKCGNIIEVTSEGQGQIICCNEPMMLQSENTVEASKEKHIPVVEIDENEVLVKVGTIEHPMEKNHYIEWIEVETPSSVYKKYLNPGEKPEAIFNTNEDIISTREYCNVHGLWKA